MEYLDIINDNNEIIGNAPKKEIYEKKLTHRIVHVLVFDEKGRFALQMRSNATSFCPNHWSTSVGGHVQAGENYEQAAIRESIEELGIEPELEFIGQFLYTGTTHTVGLKKILGVFRAIHPGPFIIEDKAVDRVEFFSLGKVGKMVEQGEKFHPELLFLLTKDIWDRRQK